MRIYILGIVGIVLAGIVIAGIFSYRFTSSGQEETVAECLDFNQATVRVDDHEFLVAMAKSPDERAKGLGGCEELKNNQGLYFPYEEPRETAFWMKGMIIPIDIVWIVGGEVVAVEHNLQPPDDPEKDDLPIYESPGAVDGVLEIAGGIAKQYGIEKGSKISF